MYLYYLQSKKPKAKVAAKPMAKPKAKPGMRGGRSSIPMYDSSKDPDQEACAWRRPGWKPAAKTTSPTQPTAKTTPPQAGRAAAKAAKAPEGGKQKTNGEKRQKRIAVDSSDEED